MQEKTTQILTLEKQLVFFQDIDPVYHHLYTTWQTAKDDLTKILRNIVLVFPHYSLHDASHAETIVHRIEAVLGEERIAKLHPTEIWLFLMSAYTHDLGMLVRDEELHDLWQSEAFRDYLQSLLNEDKLSDLQDYARLVLQHNAVGAHTKHFHEDWPVDVKWAVSVLSADYFRRYHPERSEKIICHPEITSKFFSFDFSFHHFIHERFILLLGKIATLHGKGFQDILSDLDYRCQGMGLADDVVYPRRIAAMLRLGDLLDMDNGRFDCNALPLLGKVPDTTVSHQKKHASLTHFFINPQSIEASFDCPDEDSYEAAGQWMMWLKKETENLALHWNDIVEKDFGSAPNLKSVNIKLQGKHLKGDALRHFDFNNDTIFELMEGSNIYKNRFSCLRELIQNAEDASKLQLWEDIQKGYVKLSRENVSDYRQLTPFDISIEELQKYTVQVVLKYDQEKKQYCVEVSDHGIGISDTQLEQMGKVADSWHTHNKKTYQNMPAWLNPTGAFGLGLQSVFQITDELHCITLPARESAKEIIFRSRRKGGRISCRDIDYDPKRSEGTQFSFTINKQEFDRSDLTYTMGGIYDRIINSLDPFTYKPEEREIIDHLYYLLDCIWNDVDVDIIPVSISIFHGDELERKFPLMPSAATMDFLDGEQCQDKNLLIGINWENAIAFAYNKEKCITYDLYLNADGHYSMTFSFKGMSVKYDGWQVGFPAPYGSKVNGNISFDGFPTREYLTLSRERIRKEKSRELLDQLINDVEHIFIQVFIELVRLDENKKATISKEMWLTLASFSELLESRKEKIIETSSLGNTIKYAREIILNHLQASCLAYQCLEIMDQSSNFKVERRADCSLRDFLDSFWRGQEVWIVSVNEEFPFQKKDYQEDIELERIISAQSNKQSFKDILVYSYQQMKYFLSMESFHVLEIYGVKGRKGYLYHCKRDRADVFDLPEISENVRDDVNKSLTEEPRRTISASSRYKNIAVKRLPTIFWRTYHYFNVWRIGNIPKIISPFMQEDIDEFQDGSLIDAETCWNAIKGRKDFQALVDYVKKYNVNTDVTKQEIVDIYKLWIEDIFKALKKT